MHYYKIVAKMIILQIVTSGLLFLLISVSNATGDALPNRLPLYQCHRNDSPQPPPPRKPHVFVYVEDRAFKNIIQQVRHHPRKFSNYEITKSDVPYPIGCNGCRQEVLHVMNRDRLNNGGNIPALPDIPTQIPSPFERMSSDERKSAESSEKPEQSEDKECKPNKDSILVQIPINKYFDCKNTEILIKIGKKEETETKPPNKEPVVYRPPAVQPYNANIKNQLSKLKVDENRDDAFQKLGMSPRPVRPASYLNTEVQTIKRRPEPRIVELPISFANLEPSLPPNKDESQPQYMVLPPEVLEPMYSNHQSVPTPEDQIKNIVFSGDVQQQNLPETCSPVGYTLDQRSMLNLNEQEQADLNACHHTNNNVPIKDIDIAEFESFAQQDQAENQEKCEKCSTKPEPTETETENTNKESKKSNRRAKSKCGHKDDKEYGLILGPAEP